MVLDAISCIWDRLVQRIDVNIFKVNLISSILYFCGTSSALRKRVAENRKISFQIFEINRSFLECIGNSWNLHGIHATLWF